jgi:hypothetical protein
MTTASSWTTPWNMALPPTGRTSSRPSGHLKHGYSWDRTLLDGKTGATTWCGLAVLAPNLVKISALASRPRAGARGQLRTHYRPSALRLFQAEVASVAFFANSAARSHAA